MWTTMQFWESMFYSDVQNHIRALYLETEEGDKQNNSVSTSLPLCHYSEQRFRRLAHSEKVLGEFLRKIRQLIQQTNEPVSFLS